MSETVCPAAEDLATLADRDVSASERRRLLQHLSECDDCYVAFAETIRLNEETSNAEVRVPSPDPDVRHVAHPIRHRPVWPTGRRLPLAAAASLIAASLAVGITGLQWWSRRTPQVAEPASSSPPSAELAPSATPPPDLASPNDRPAWTRNASWNTSSRSSLSFASAPPSRRAFVLGMHFAALDRACHEVRLASKQAAAREIDQSLEAAVLVSDDERRQLMARAIGSQCAFPSPVAGPTAPWFDLGRALESWRIAVVERHPSAFGTERRRELERLIAAVELDRPARRLAVRLVQTPAQADEGSWGSLRSDLTELIELLCV